MKLRALHFIAVGICSTLLLRVDPLPVIPEVPCYVQPHFDGPAEFASFHRAIRTRPGAVGPEYTPGYKVREFQKAKTLSRARSGSRVQSATVDWIERGPANVPGRTRGLIVDPDDPTTNTWFAGSAGGGVWKTTNAGATWTLLTPDLSNLATTVLAMAGSNHDIIYLGTGEDFNNIDGVNGNGIFKSTDRGVTWTHLPSTIEFRDVSRLAIAPSNPSIVVAATATGIYRTIDGGDNWTQVLNLTSIQDLKATPGNFNIQYASKRSVGIYKSTDAGINWVLSSTGMSPGGRVEIAVSPVNPSRVFASAEGGISGGTGDLYVSDDAGNTWALVAVNFNGSPADFLGGQGWYDNTIACDPFNASVVYVGGINIFRVALGTGFTEVPNYTIEENDTESFLFLNSFQGIAFDGQRLTVGPNGGQRIVEVRFGLGLNQRAHRFRVPSGATSGVPPFSYTYANYVAVPFQAWDVTNPLAQRQLMVSFRDQANNGEFDLLHQYFGVEPELNSREYIYIHDVDYSTEPNPSIAVPGGHEHRLMYNFFPALAEGAVWNPYFLPVSTLLIQYSGVPKMNATTITVSDAYNQFDGKNRFVNWGIDLHPDQHNMVMIQMSPSSYRILLANDGGIFYSNISSTPGINQGNWTQAGIGYRTTQFYGADKRPGFDQYAGGTQDNGTWRSPSTGPSTAATNYNFSFGGDGFEVIWNNLDDRKIIGGSQGNNFRRTTDGGQTWNPAVSGISGLQPFISKLANSKDNPDRIYTLSSAGVFRSGDFGGSWSLTPITVKWGGVTSLMDVEVSRANANIVWAGSGMADPLTNIHVSTDAGVTFTPADNPSASLISGGITKLASHPTEENTAYALFSQAGNPKILRTMDLGQTWEDISGFQGVDVSTRGFPDVAVYCLYVRPDNTDILWAGTEIGIVESLDNGLSWALIDDFPNISVWDMKGQDDQVVIATHGRGIWTATIHEPQISVNKPEIVAWGTSPKEKLLLKVNVQDNFDQIDLYLGPAIVKTFTNVNPSTFVVELSGLPAGQMAIKMISYRGTAPFHSKIYDIEHLDILAIDNSYVTYFDNVNTISVSGFGLNKFPGEILGTRKVLHSVHPYNASVDHTTIIRHPVIVSASLPFLYYEDVAIVEPGVTGAPFGSEDFKDYVVMEASKNGLDWTPLTEGYNANFNAAWLTTYNEAGAGSRSMFVPHEIDLTNTFAVEDTLLFRYRLFSNASATAWGAAVDYIAIQVEPTGLEQKPAAKNYLSVFPNPVIRDFTAEYDMTTPGYASMEVIDLFGRVLQYRDVSQSASGVYRESFTMTGQLSGTYFVVLKSPAGNLVARVVVRR